MTGTKHDGSDTSRQRAPEHTEPPLPLYDNDSMKLVKSPVFNDMKHHDSQHPSLHPLHIGDQKADEHYQKIAKEGADFIATNGNTNIAVRHAFDEARENDKKNGGHHSVDALLNYMNKELKAQPTPFSLAVVNDSHGHPQLLLLDSRENQHPKVVNGKTEVRPRETLNIDSPQMKK